MVGVLTLSRALAAGGTVIWEPMDRPRLRVPPEWAEGLRRDGAEVREVLQRAVEFRRQLDRSLGGPLPLLVLADAPQPLEGRCISCGASSDRWRCLACRVALAVVLDDTAALREALADMSAGPAA